MQLRTAASRLHVEHLVDNEAFTIVAYVKVVLESRIK